MPKTPDPLLQAIVPVRVRYQECDPMNVAHHSAYPVWLEIARTELLRQQGQTYRDLEAAGEFLVVARLSVCYRRPARYDDLLDVRVELRPTAGVKLEHVYEIVRGGELLATAKTTLACVDAEGALRPVPQRLLNPGP